MSEGMQSGKYWRTPGTKEQQERIATLEAHVAALVQALEDAAATVRGVGELHIWQQKLTEWDELLHAPALAALVGRAEKEQAVIAAAREVRENFPDGRLQEWEQALVDTLAAIDTTEP